MSKIGILGLVNVAPQDVEAGALVDLGVVYRQFSSKSRCGVPTFSNFGGTNGSRLNHRGFYKITVTATVSAPVAGDVVLQLQENGVDILGAVITQTITTATTEFQNVALDYIVLVDNDLILNYPTTTAKTITIRNTGDIVATITNIVTNFVKEV